MCCTGRNRKRNLSAKVKFTSKWPKKKRVVSRQAKFRAQKAAPATIVPSRPATQLPIRWRSMPTTMLVEYTGGKRKAFTVEGYEFSKNNRIQAVDVADVGALLKRPDFRGKT